MLRRLLLKDSPHMTVNTLARCGPQLMSCCYGAVAVSLPEKRSVLKQSENASLQQFNELFVFFPLLSLFIITVNIIS